MPIPVHYPYIYYLYKSYYFFSSGEFLKKNSAVKDTARHRLTKEQVLFETTAAVLICIDYRNLHWNYWNYWKIRPKINFKLYI